jgi:hypothetical protein
MVISGVVPIGANLLIETPTLSLPLSGGGKSEPLARSFGLVAGACRLLHLPLKGGGRREAPGGGHLIEIAGSSPANKLINRKW